MPGWLNNRARASAPRTLSSLAIAGVGAAVALAAAAPATSAAPHAAAHHHHTSAHHHAKHVTVKGLVAAHKGRTVTVFAKTAKLGAATRHNKRVHVTFARSVHHARTKIHAGNRVHISGVGRIHHNHVTIVRHSDETVTSSPASLFFGTIVSLGDQQFVVREQTRDDGDHEDGNDDGHGDDGDSHISPADHGPGDNSGPGHMITVDDANATITVDGSTDTPLEVGDTVAVLGEATEDTVVAADVFAFNNAPDFLRGEISAIDGDNVTLGDDNEGDDESSDVAGHHGGDDGDDDSVTVSLADVPLALNGNLGASTADLSVGDKLIVIGSSDPETGAFTADIAFAFNSDDHQPCDGGDDGGHGGHDGGDDD
jgi:hypothetical protein